MPDPMVTAGITIARVVLQRTAPTGIALIRSWLRGKTILVVGPGHSGKSTFVRYLQYGIFQHEEPYEKTYQPVSGPRFNLRLGVDRSLEVLVKKAWDAPAQYADPANLVADARPHALLVVVDLSMPLDKDGDNRSTAPWLEEFASRLDDRFRDIKRSSNRLTSIIVVMNKADLVDDTTRERHTQRYREILRRHFQAARGRNMKAPVRIKPCISVENPEGTKFIDAILVDLAQDLTS